MEVAITADRERVCGCRGVWGGVDFRSSSVSYELIAWAGITDDMFPSLRVCVCLGVCACVSWGCVQMVKYPGCLLLELPCTSLQETYPDEKAKGNFDTNQFSVRIMSSDFQSSNGYVHVYMYESVYGVSVCK